MVMLPDPSSRLAALYGQAALTSGHSDRRSHRRRVLAARLGDRSLARVLLLTSTH